MINILSYIFYNLSNLLFVILLPKSFVKIFFINYSVASGLFTFLVFYHFTKKKFFKENNLIYMITFGLILLEFINTKAYIIWYFTFLLIYSDYFFSQRKNFLINISFKILLFFSSFFLYKNFLDPIEVIKIKIIIIYFTFIFYYLFAKKNKFLILKVSSPIVYNLWTCLIYFSTLFFITIFVPDLFIKIIYISFQIIIGIQLKLFDLKIRSFKLDYSKINIIFNLLSFSYIFILSIYTNVHYLILIYLIIFFSLNFLRSKYILQ